MQANTLNVFIKNYIESSRLKSAIMINGPWGIGKSYYIENELVPYLKLECEYNIIQVSLYGINSIQELNKQIYLEARAKRINQKKEKLVAGKVVAKTIINGITSFFNINTNISEDDLQKLYDSIDLTNKILIFEDLERSQIDIVEVLGFVNTLVDNDKVKVLLVANENEIVKGHFQLNNKTKENDFFYNEKELKYLQIKEKTVSETITFSVDLKKSINNIIAEFKNDKLSQILNNEMQIKIIKKLKDKNHQNLRTLIFALQKSTEIFKYIDNKEDDYIFKIILEDILDISIKLKAKDKDKSKQSISSSIIEQYEKMSTNFCANYIVNQIIDEESVKDGILIIKKEMHASKLQGMDPDLDIIINFTNEEDDRIANSFNNILLKLEDNTFPYNQIDSLISYSVFLKSYIAFNYSKLKELILDYSKNISSINNLFFRQTIAQLDSDSINEYNSFINDFNRRIEEKHQQHTEANLNTLILDIDRFYKYVWENDSLFLNKKKFLSLIKITEIMKFITNANNKDITTFRHILKNIYRFSNIKEYFIQDIQSLEELYKEIKKYKEDKSIENKKIKKLIIDWLLNDLIEILNQLGYTIST